MATNMNRTGDAQQVTVHCSCGKRLSALPQHAGKRVKCPACGQAVVVPGSSSPQPVPAAPQVNDESEGMSRNTLVALWSFVGVFAFGCVLFLVWNSHSSHQARIAAANDRVSQAVAVANEWIAENAALDGETVEQQLAVALKDEVATEKGNGESVLSQVRQQREQLAEQARIVQAQRAATVVFNDANRQIDGKRITDAIALLRKYVADPHATEKADAQRLLIEAETAVSDMLTLDALIAMSDEEFGQVKAGDEVRDGKVTQPVLLAVRNETVQRNLDKAGQLREEVRIAKGKRREAERLAAIEHQRQEEERSKQEAAQLANVERLREERERPKDGTELFKKITTFPERFIGDNYYISGILYSGHTRRNAEYKCFSLRFAATAAVDGGPYRKDRISFITSEEMGEALVEMSDGDYNTTVYVKLQYLDPEKKEYPVGYVTKIDFLAFDTDELKRYKGFTYYDTGKKEIHPNPFKR